MWERLLRMIGEESFEKLQHASILIVGIGGVGGYALEALARSGIGHLTIMDDDLIDLSNLNRQIITHQNNIGKEKVLVAKDRVKEIAPDCQVTVIFERLTAENVSNLSLEKFDFVIDAIDDISAKVVLIKQLKKIKKTFISSLGTGNRLQPELLEITTLSKTSHDPLAKKLRLLLRKEQIDLDIPVVWSREDPIPSKALGSCCPVPMAAGSMLASYAMRVILKKG